MSPLLGTGRTGDAPAEKFKNGKPDKYLLLMSAPIHTSTLILRSNSIESLNHSAPISVIELPVFITTCKKY
jgi:hypothetical protein